MLDFSEIKDQIISSVAADLPQDLRPYTYHELYRNPKYVYHKQLLEEVATIESKALLFYIPKPMIIKL